MNQILERVSSQNLDTFREDKSRLSAEFLIKLFLLLSRVWLQKPISWPIVKLTEKPTFFDNKPLVRCFTALLVWRIKKKKQKNFHMMILENIKCREVIRNLGWDLVFRLKMSKPKLTMFSRTKKYLSDRYLSI